MSWALCATRARWRTGRRLRRQSKSAAVLSRRASNTLRPIWKAVSPSCVVALSSQRLGRIRSFACCTRIAQRTNAVWQVPPERTRQRLASASACQASKTTCPTSGRADGARPGTAPSAAAVLKSRAASNHLCTTLKTVTCSLRCAAP